MSGMLFHSWAHIGRVLAVGTLAYVGLVLMLRISGKRTLSKMNAFDLVVTVALGSTFATVLLSKDVALAEGMVALALLVIMQVSLAWLAVRFSFVRRLITASPRLLFYRGEFLSDGMRTERVTRDEVLAAIRAQGLANLRAVGAVVLETDGSFTVIKGSEIGAPDALNDVEGWPDGSRA